MDPNIRAQSSGFRPEPGENDNSVNYLRRLKEQIATDSAGHASPTTGTESAGTRDYSKGKDRRRSPRYACHGSVTFTAEGSAVRMWGTLTDISLRGCYVEVSTTFPVDTKVDMVIEAKNIRVRAIGSVRISYPFLGMGILITDMAPEQRVFLEQLLATLAQATTVANPLSAKESIGADVLAAADPIALLQEIRRFFEKNVALSREEFLRIAARCQRT